MKKALPLWVKVIVVVAASLFAAGSVIAVMRPELLVARQGEMNSAARVYAGYMFSRNLALAVMLLAAWIKDTRQALSGLMLLAALVQLLDAGLDAAEGRIMLVPGIVVLCALFSFAAVRIPEGFFRRAAPGPPFERR